MPSILSLSRLSLIVVLILTLIPIEHHHYSAGATVLESQSSDEGGPTINDPSLKVDLVFNGLKSPTSMAFLGPNDILVLEKNNGTVQRVINGNMLPQPLLNVNVVHKGESGMLGIAIAKHKNGPTYVFLFYTESSGRKNSGHVTSGIQPLDNHLYRYELVNNKLVNPKLLLDLPTSPAQTPNHNGGKILIGPDQNVYVVIGDVDKFYNQYSNHLPLSTKAQNLKNGEDPDGAGGILRVTQDGKPVKGILGDKFPLNLYYAYGIRNSFGMDFDPVTGKLWDTENGPDYGDEINLVEPGFNSGWGKVQGIWENNGSSAGPIMLALDPHMLVDFGGKGKYRAPELTWNKTVAPTGLKILNSTKLGKQYQNDMFVGDYNNGNLYHFKLNQNRTGLVLNGPLADKIAASPKEIQGIILGHGFSAITDIQVGPDGYLYVLSVMHSSNYSLSTQGTIFRIVPANQEVSDLLRVL